MADKKSKKIKIGTWQALALLLPYIKDRIISQIKSVWLIIFYLVFFQTIILRIAISEALNDSITYRVPKFKEGVTIPDSFAGFLRSIGSIEEMASMGIITGKIAGILESELGELAVEREASSLEGGIKRRGSKKARAFALFSEGKRPSDSEVKSLGIKPESTYRYYQDWKKAHNSSKNST